MPEQKILHLEDLVNDLDVLVKKIESRFQVHESEHEYLRLLIEEHKIRKETWLLIRNKVLTGTVWAALLALGSATALAMKTWFNS